MNFILIEGRCYGCVHCTSVTFDLFINWMWCTLKGRYYSIRVASGMVDELTALKFPYVVFLIYLMISFNDEMLISNLCGIVSEFIRVYPGIQL